MKKNNIKVVLIVILLVVIDQLIKFFVINNISNGSDIIIIDNFLKFTYLVNTGGAFGILGSTTPVLIIISIVLIWYIIKELQKNDGKLYVYSLVLVLCGALGNLTDRVFRGHVIDYISFSLFNKEMPVFNFADILITFGILLIIYIIVRGGSNDKKDK